jgi:hypothetical protein
LLCSSFAGPNVCVCVCVCVLTRFVSDQCSALFVTPVRLASIVCVCMCACTAFVACREMCLTRIFALSAFVVPVCHVLRLIGRRLTCFDSRAAQGQRESVCPTGTGWYVQVINFRTVVVELQGSCCGDLSGGNRAGGQSGQHTGAGVLLFSCLQGRTLVVMHLLYYRKAPSRHAFPHLVLLIHSA